MNLIEQLGGYDSAKRYLEELRKIPLHEQAEDTITFLPDELLEYRRANNIFEDKDKVVSINLSEPSYLYTVNDITNKGYSYGNDWGWYGVISVVGVGYSFRHATDLEITAGHRL